MKKLVSFLMAFLLVFGVYSNINRTSLKAEEQKILKVEIREENYLEKLLNSNEYLKKRIKDFEKDNIVVDNTVRTIKGVDFVYYSNSDNSVVGLIELHKDLTSEIRINLVNSNIYSIEFIKENGDKKVIGKDKNGQFNKILFESNAIKTRSDWWCPYVVGLVGTSISSLYTSIAAAIGGPIAAIIVAGVSSVGWTYVSSKCDD